MLPSVLCVERERGFVDAGRAPGVGPDALLRTTGDYGTSSGYDATREAFRQGRPTALVCGNDPMAVGGRPRPAHLLARGPR